MQIINKVLGRYASPSMPCPHCGANKARFIETVGFGISRWRCGACKGTWRYLKADQAPYDPSDIKKNPMLLVGGPSIARQHISKMRGTPIVGREANLVRKIARS